MKKLILFLSVILLFSACSITKVQHLRLYKKNYLQDNDIQTKFHFQKAVQEAKSSKDYNTLGILYLSECGLNNSLGIQDKCDKYLEIKNKINNKEYDAFMDLIHKKIKKEQVKFLCKNYRSFVYAMLLKDYKKANEEVLKIEPLTSQLVSANLIKEHLEVQTIKDIINNNYYFGYKKAVIYWMIELKNRVPNEKEKNEIIQKIKTLKNE